VHDKHVVRAPVGHEAHGAVQPVVKMFWVHAVPAAFKVYPAAQAVQVRVAVLIVQLAQLVIPVTAGVVLPAEQEVQVEALLTI